ncbi:MAG TPA: Ig-like domain-containing protein [Bryobacteraceae bacterium]
MNLSKLALAALLLSNLGAAASVSVQLDNEAFKVTGWTATAEPASGWASVFTVSTGPDVPPLFGSYSVENGTLTFHPRFPLASGVTYRAAFHLAGSAPVEAVFNGPAMAAAPPTRVVAMYPSAPTLPSNQLKLYLVFSAPMQSGDIWPKIHLIDQDGKPSVLPFVELDQELWNRDHTRLTLLFDPGRIKRGVKPNVDMGPVLEEGKRYTLILDRNLKDAHGVPLEAAFRHEFTAGPAERRGIDPKQWKITAPTAATVNPLVIDFDRPLDYALLQDVFKIPGVEGVASVGPGETQWRFQPTQRWKAAEFTLIIDMALEDLAGNRIGRPFDVDTMVNPTGRISAPTTSLTFRTR